MKHRLQSASLSTGAEMPERQYGVHVMRRHRLEVLESRYCLDASVCNPPSFAGDANADGSSDEQDIIDVFVAGKYNSGELASWAEGDWNCDGVFDSGDLLEAFVVGKFRAGVVSDEHSAHHRDDVPRGKGDPPIADPPIDAPSVDPPVGHGQPENRPPLTVPPVDNPPFDTPVVDGQPDDRPPADLGPPNDRPPASTPPFETPPVDQGEPDEHPPVRVPPVDGGGSAK